MEIARISAVQMLSEGFPPGGKRAQRPQAILRVTLSIEAGGGPPHPAQRVAGSLRRLPVAPKDSCVESGFRNSPGEWA